MALTVHHRGPFFTASVEEDEPKEYMPVVADDGLQFGVGIIDKENAGSFWGLLSPRQPIACWRATEVLSRLTEIGNGDLCNAYYTGCRNVHGSDLPRVDGVIERIGQEAYDEIMAMPIPEHVVRFIVGRQESDMPPAMYEITEEVRAGTLEWREEFSKIGAKHPDAVDAEKRRQKQIIARFEDHLQAYADYRELPRECLGMGHVEGALVEVIDKGIEQQGEDVVMGTAALLGELHSSDFTAFLMPGAISEQGHYANMERIKLEKAESIASWLTKRFSQRRFGQRWFPLFGKRDGRSVEEYRQLLVELIDKHFRKPKEATAT